MIIYKGFISYLKPYDNLDKTYGGALSITFIVIGNSIGHPSSNLACSLLRANALGKSLNPYIFPSAVGK